MVVQCSNCQTRFRVAPEKISPQGARMRCSKCSTIFSIPPPSEQAGSVPSVQRATGLVVEADPATATKIISLLSRWGIPSVALHDGSEALLTLHRERPAVAILGGHLPNVPSPVIAEIVRRTSELRSVKLIRVVTVDEPPGTPEFDAEHTLEPADLPDGLEPLLEQLGIGRRPAEPTPARPAAQAEKKPPAKPAAAAAPPPVKPAADPSSSEVASPAAPKTRRRRKKSRPVSDDPQVAAAERLARIIVSDIILYNEAKFASGVKDGDVVAAVKNELNEGTQLFQQRISSEVREKQDFLGDELAFRARQLLAGG